MLQARVLIVDDEPAARTGLSELVSDWGYETQVASDGEEAWQVAMEFQPTVVISDIFMPRLDGFGLLTRLHEAYPDTAVILLTGQASIEGAMRAPRGTPASGAVKGRWRPSGGAAPCGRAPRPASPARSRGRAQPPRAGCCAPSRASPLARRDAPAPPGTSR